MCTTHLTRGAHEEVAEEGAGGAVGVAGYEGELALSVPPGAVQDPAQSVRHQQRLQ